MSKKIAVIILSLSQFSTYFFIVKLFICMHKIIENI